MEFLIDYILDKIVEIIEKLKIANEKIAERKRRKKNKEISIRALQTQCFRKNKSGGFSTPSEIRRD